MKTKLYIGVDPDVTRSGIAFLTSDGDWSLHTTELFNIEHLIYKTIKQLNIQHGAAIKAVVESPSSDSADFGAAGLFRSKRIQLAVKGSQNAEARALAIVLKIARKKGRCIQIAEEIIKIFNNLKIEVERVKPSSRVRCDSFPLNRTDVKSLRQLFKSGRKYKYPTKLSHSRFVRLTGVHDKTTNEEKRDAALILIQTYLNLNKQ